MTSRLLRLPDVQAITGLSRSSLYAYIKEGSFPQQIPIGLRARAWLASDVESWVNKKAESRTVTK